MTGRKLHEDGLIGGATLLIVHTHGDYTDLSRWLEIDQSGGGVLVSLPLLQLEEHYQPSTAAF